MAIAADKATDTAGNANNAAQRFSIVRTRAPDLELMLLSPPATAVAGANAIYAIQITNISLSNASGFAIDGTLPVALVLDRDNSSGDVIIDRQHVTINVEGLLAGESTLRTITGRLLSTLAAGSSFDVTFTASSINFTDKDPSNNSDSATTTVVRQADVSVSVTDGPDPALIGGFNLYTLTVKNNGPAVASNVIVTHTLPAGFTFDATNSDADAVVNGQAVRYTIAALGSTEERIFTIATTISELVGTGEVTANTTVVATETDPAQGNNAATTRTRLVRGNTGGPPVATADSVTADEDQSLSIPVETLLGNDTNVTVISGVTQPAHGDLEFDSDANAFVYTPDPNFSGPDSFRYTVEGTIAESLVLAIMTGTGEDVATSQIAIRAADWSTGLGSANFFFFNVESNEASPAVLSALTSGELIPTVTLLARNETTVRNQTTFVETLRWTMHNVRFNSYSFQGTAGESLASETYAASFEQIELDVADAPNKVGRRFHAGRDFEQDAAFNSNQFGPLPLALPLAKNFGNDKPGLFINDPDGNLGAAELEWAHFGVSNNADLGTETEDVRPSANSVFISLGGKRDEEEQAAAVFLQKALDGSALAKLELTRGVAFRDSGRVESKWTLTNAKVRTFATTLSADGSTYAVELEYEKIDLEQVKFEADGTVDRRAIAKLDLTPQATDRITGKDEFGHNTIEPGVTEQILDTPFGDLVIDDFSVQASPVGDRFAFQTFTFKTSGGVGSPGLFASAASGAYIDELTFTEYTTDVPVANRVPLVAWVLTDPRLVSHHLETFDGGDRPSVTEIFQVIAKTLKTTINDPALPDAQDPTATFDQVDQTTDPDPVNFGSTSANQFQGDHLLLRIGAAFVEIDSFNWSVGRSGEGQSSTVNGNEIRVQSRTGNLSPKLLAALATHTEIPLVELITRRSVEGPGGSVDLQTLVLTNVTFVGYSQSNKEGENPTETFDLRFDSAEVKIVTISDTGQVSAPFRTGINFTDGSPLQRNIPAFPLSLSDFHESDRGLFLSDGNRLAELKEFSVSLQAAGNGPVQPSVTLTTDSPEASLRLLDAMLTGTNFGELTLLRKQGGHISETWRLTNAVIGGYATDSADPLSPPANGFTLTFEKLDITHTPRDARGIPLDGITASIDLSDNSVTVGDDFGDVHDRAAAGHNIVDLGPSEIEVFTAGWGASAFTAGTNTQTFAGAFSFTTVANATLPGLFAKLVQGQAFDELKYSEFTGRRDGDPGSVVENTKWLLTGASLTSVQYAVQDDGAAPQVSFTVDADRLAQTLKFVNARGDVTTIPTADFNFETQETVNATPFTDLERIPTSTATVSINVRPEFVDVDGDLVDDRVEGNAPNSGDGNSDNIKDNTQTNVTSLPHPVSGNFVTLAAPSGQELKMVEIETPTATPPPDLDFRVGLIGYELNNAPADSAETTITIFVNGVSGFNTYYKFGPTAQNPTPHYYRFLFDSNTRLGAEILSDRIIVHLKDGLLGDDDLMVNGKIVDPGAPVVNNSAFPFQNPIVTLDVSDDGSVSPIDVLQVINELNTSGSHLLPTTLAFPIVKFSFLDPSGDNFVSPLDALQVINFLNDANGEGEQLGAPASSFETYAQAADRAVAELDDAPARFRATRSLIAEDANAPRRNAVAATTSLAERSRRAAVRDPNATAELLDETACDEIFAGLGD